jgi:TPP-dependent pyruvate/acetoin dehydrogenase alpha subunit
MKARDPLLLFRQRLLSEKVLSEAQDARLQEEVKGVIEAAMAQADAAPYPPAEDAAYPVYVEDVRRG